MRGRSGTTIALPPRGLGIHVTHRCNLRCKMCWWWGDWGSRPHTSEMTTAQIKGILDKVKGVVEVISIGGGEPLMREDILEIVEYVSRLGFRCEVLTNGTLITPEIAKGLVRCGVHVVISLEGHEAVNDSIRGDGSFAKAVRGLKLVQAEGGVTRITTTINSLNVHCLDRMIELASSLNSRLAFQHLIYNHPNKLSQLDTELLINQLNLCLEKSLELGVPFYTTPSLRGDREVELWYSELTPIPGMYCSFPWIWLYVQPDGEIKLCEYINYSFGNILHDDLETIWNGDRAKELRETLMKGLLHQACVRCCKLETC